MEFLFHKGLLPADLIGKITYFFSITGDSFRAENSLFLGVISANVLSFQANYITGYVSAFGKLCSLLSR